MRYLVLLLLMLVGCSGQAQQACPGLSAAEVNTLITLAEVDQADGFTKSQELQGILNECQTQDCVTCAVTVVDMVYGKSVHNERIQTWVRYDGWGEYLGCVVDGEEAGHPITPGISECTCLLMIPGEGYSSYLECKEDPNETLGNWYQDDVPGGPVG